MANVDLHASQLVSFYQEYAEGVEDGVAVGHVHCGDSVRRRLPSLIAMREAQELDIAEEFRPGFRILKPFAMGVHTILPYPDVDEIVAV